MNPLTDVQAKYLAWITVFIQDNGYSPSYLEAANAFHVNPTAARDNIMALERKGIIKRTPGISRSIVVLEPTEE